MVGGWGQGAHAVCSNETEDEEESQVIKIQKRNQKRDADLWMIINNALRNKNQTNA